MERRTFVKLLAASPLASGLPVEAEADIVHKIPPFKIVTPYKAEGDLGMPGPYPGQVVSVKAEKSWSADGKEFNPDVIREMMERGMRALTGEAKTIDAWRRFIKPDVSPLALPRFGGQVLGECIETWAF